MTKVENRRKVLINAAFFIFILGAFYLFMKYAFGLLFPFLFAFFVALLLQKPINFFQKKSKGKLKKGLLAGVFVTLFYLIILAILSLIGVRVINEFRNFFSYLAGYTHRVPELLNSVGASLSHAVRFLPDHLEAKATASIQNFFHNLSLYASNAEGAENAQAQNAASMLNGWLSKFDFSMLKTPLNGVVSTAKQIPSFVIALVATVISTFFLTTSYDQIVSFIKRQITKRHGDILSSTKGIFLSSLRKLGKAYATIIFITFTELVIGLSVLKLLGVYSGSYMFTVSIITALIDILPVFGTGIVIVPWALYELIMGNFGFAIGLVVIYIVIAVIRQFIEPKLVASNLGLPPIVTFAGMYLGGRLFGVIGLFLVPIIIILLKLLNDDGIIHIWRNHNEAPPAEDEDGDAAKAE